MKGFQQRVYAIVARVPEGYVVTYGQIAAALEEPQAARMVGWAMHNCPEGLPWHRVINSQGRVSLSGGAGDLQRALLVQEGVRFDEQGCVELAKYLWDIKKEDANRTSQIA